MKIVAVPSCAKFVVVGYIFFSPNVCICTALHYSQFYCCSHTSFSLSHWVSIVSLHWFYPSPLLKSWYMPCECVYADFIYPISIYIYSTMSMLLYINIRLMCLTDDDNLTTAAVECIWGALEMGHKHIHIQFIYRYKIAFKHLYMCVCIRGCVCIKYAHRNIIEPPHKSYYIHVLCWRQRHHQRPC